MSFKVGDEVRTRTDNYFADRGSKGSFVLKCGDMAIVDFDAGQSVATNSNDTRRWSVMLWDLTHACPIARESAKLAAKVEQLEAEVNAWIERMRRGEW